VGFFRVDWVCVNWTELLHCRQEQLLDVVQVFSNNARKGQCRIMISICYYTRLSCGVTLADAASC